MTYMILLEPHMLPIALQWQNETHTNNYQCAKPTLQRTATTHLIPHLWSKMNSFSLLRENKLKRNINQTKK